MFLPNWVGDAVMATPTLRALRRHFGPAVQIIGIMRPLIEEVLRGTSWLDATWLYDPSRSEFHLRPRGLVWRLMKTRVDVSVHLTNDLVSAAVARLGGVRLRAGYARNRRGWLLSRRLEAPHDGHAYTPVSALDYYLAIAYAIGCWPEAPRMELGTEPADEAAADQAWSALGIAPREPVVLLNSSGAFGSAKLWPEEAFAALARRIARELDHTVVILCGPAERERAAAIAARASDPRVSSLARRPLSIGLSKACVRRARCLVSTDSGPRHFAGAFGVPAVALFGPTKIEWSDTHCEREIRVQKAVPCGPCGQRECPELHHACMRELTVGEVLAAVARALGTGGVR